MPIPSPPSFKGRVAVITGATRGIGRECALLFAKLGCHVVVIGKSTEEKPNLPGTVFTVARECSALGAEAMPYALDMRDAAGIEACIDAVIKKFGRVDILVNNASALWWHSIPDTPMNKYDLITSINTRGTFAITKACMPHMLKQDFGRIVNMSPPIVVGEGVFSGKTAYNISKYGMSMVALGAADEARDAGRNVTANTLWPATIVESFASINFQLGDRAMWRKASILADATALICAQGREFTGRMLIDDDFLRTLGATDRDFVQYRCDPAVEPPRALAKGSTTVLNRGDVRQLTTDTQTDRIPSKL
eukprot:TRINITY_DN57041_c0_g1_i1.p1 TRINITY_DN57041_c0_g1~~TRINITY_DN57041_c0_g1_i1.p1  ORF type:complete len:307 (-),score=62.28 TRINITY_DN57041_c0_g1_i1:211-1131(-)